MDGDHHRRHQGLLLPPMTTVCSMLCAARRPPSSPCPPPALPRSRPRGDEPIIVPARPGRSLDAPCRPALSLLLMPLPIHPRWDPLASWREHHQHELLQRLPRCACPRPMAADSLFYTFPMRLQLPSLPPLSSSNVSQRPTAREDRVTPSWAR